MSSHDTIRAAAIVLLACGVLAGPVLADTSIEKNFDFPGGRLIVDTDVGSVSVSGGSGSGARVYITSSRDDLEDVLTFSFEEDGGELRILAKKRDRSFWSRGFRGKLHYEIEVPTATELDIDTSGGSIEVDSTNGDARLDTSGGYIRVYDVDGEIEADTSGGSITIERVEGDVNADTSGGGITIEQVNGDVRADTSGGGIRMREVTGDIQADTSGGPITIEAAGGEVLAETSGGSITVEFTPGNSRGGSLSTSGGGVRVSLDSSADLELDASTSGGSVRSDIPIRVQGRISKTSLKGTLGSGGERLRIRASGGGIRISEL